MRSQWRVIAVMVALLVSACADGPTGTARDARVIMSFLTPATVRTVVVEVSGPGISPAVVANIPIGADSTARDTLTLTAGAGRRFVITALDSSGVETHRADTTITLQAGANVPLSVRLEPLASALGITVTFGGVSLSVADTTTRILLIGDSLQISASAIGASGAAVPAASLVWASSNPAFATVNGGLVRGVRSGIANIAVSHLGASAHVRVEVWDTLPNTVMEVSSGGPYSCARRYDGAVYCWGTLRIGTGSYLAQPTRVAPDKKFASFSAGYSMLCGVTFEHEAFCWGSNRFGQLGTGVAPADETFETPQPLAGGHLWTEIVAGTYAACGTTYPSKTVYCWGGLGSFGSEGPFIESGSSSPVALPGGFGFSGLVVGSAHACAVRDADGLPHCWGDAALFPADGTPVASVAAEALTRSFGVGQRTVCSVTAAGAAYCFGPNEQGQLTGGGSVSALIPAASPSRVGESIIWSRFAGGRTAHFCGIASNSVGYCWGSNVSGQVGDGTTAYRASPVALPGEWLALSPGLGDEGVGNSDFTCGLSVTREVLCWGSGVLGQLGNGTLSSSLTPVVVEIP